EPRQPSGAPPTSGRRQADLSSDAARGLSGRPVSGGHPGASERTRSTEPCRLRRPSTLIGRDGFGSEAFLSVAALGRSGLAVVHPLAGVHGIGSFLYRCASGGAAELSVALRVATRAAIPVLPRRHHPRRGCRRPHSEP